MSKTLLALFICFGNSQAFICPQNSSLVNVKAGFVALSDRNWTFTASSSIDEDFEDHPFNIPLEATTQIRTKMYHYGGSDKISHRLKFEFSCGENNSKSTFTEFTKLYKKLELKDNIDTVARYCSQKNVLAWPSVFINFSQENVVMFYTCNAKIELLTIFTVNEWQKENVLEAARKFLVNFDSKILDDNKLTFVDSQKSTSDCESFKHVCLRNDTDEVQKIKKNVKENKKEFKFPTAKVTIFVFSTFAVVATAYSFWKLMSVVRDRLKRRNTVDVWRRQDINNSGAVIIEDLN